MGPSARIFVVLGVASAVSACAVALRSAEEPRGAPKVMPTPVVTTRAILPSAIPTLLPMTPAPLATFTHMTVEEDEDLLVARDPNAGSTSAAALLARVATPLVAVTPALAEPAAPVAPVAAPARVTGSVGLQRRGELRIARARLAGRELGDVLLDTGAGGTFIDRRRADDAGLPEMMAATAESKSEDGEPRLRALQGLALDDLLLAEDRAFAVDLGGTDTGPLAGVIGFGTLAVRPFTLDFPNDTLIVHSDTTFESPAGPAQAIRVDQGLPFVEARLGDGTSIWLLLDTGSPVAIGVWHGFAKQHPGVLKASPDPSGAPASELRGVQLLGETYDRLPVTVEVPTRSWQRARVVGRVGMGVLRDFRITVHATTERMWLEPAAR